MRCSIALLVLVLLLAAGARADEPVPALAHRVLAASDHSGRPFAVVDKAAATIAVYRRDGSPAGTSRVLLGRTRGDTAPPGVGERTQNGTLRLEDQTTPAGRFESLPGRNLDGEAVVWIDHDAALAIHRLRPGRAEAARARRLASASAADKRVSAGCVVVPVAFYEGVVAPVLGSGPGVVYVLPEGAASASLLRASVTTRMLRRDTSGYAAAAAASARRVRASITTRLVPATTSGIR